MCLGCARVIEKAVRITGIVAIDPQVSGGATNAEALTQFGHGPLAAQVGVHEGIPLVPFIRFHPGHTPCKGCIWTSVKDLPGLYPRLPNITLDQSICFVTRLAMRKPRANPSAYGFGPHLAGQLGVM